MKKIIFSFCLVSILALGLMIVRNYDENYAQVANVNEDANSINQVVL